VYDTVENFAYMADANPSTHATLTEERVYELVEHKTTWSPWPGDSWTEGTGPNGGEDFNQVSSGGVDGDDDYAGMIGVFSPADGALISRTYDLSSADAFVLSVYIPDGRSSPSEYVRVYFKDRFGIWTEVFTIDDCDPPDENGWRYKSLTVTDFTYRHSYFQVKYVAAIDQGSEIGIDSQRIEQANTARMEQ